MTDADADVDVDGNDEYDDSDDEEDNNDGAVPDVGSSHGVIASIGEEDGDGDVPEVAQDRLTTMQVWHLHCHTAYGRNLSGG